MDMLSSGHKSEQMAGHSTDVSFKLTTNIHDMEELFHKKIAKKRVSSILCGILILCEKGVRSINLGFFWRPSVADGHDLVNIGSIEVFLKQRIQL